MAQAAYLACMEPLLEKVGSKWNTYMETSCFRVFMLLNHTKAYVSMYFSYNTYMETSCFRVFMLLNYTKAYVSMHFSYNAPFYTFQDVHGTST